MVGRCISIYMGKSNCKYFSGILPVFQLVLFPLSLMLKPKTQKPAITSPPPKQLSLALPILLFVLCVQAGGILPTPLQESNALQLNAILASCKCKIRSQLQHKDLRTSFPF